MEENAEQYIDLNPSLLFQKLDAWLDGLVKMAPNIAVAVGVIIMAFIAGWLAQKMVTRSLTRRSRENLGQVLGGFLRFLMIILGFLIAATIVFPSLKPGDLVAGLGVSSVAIGFAFKDILQNWLAGLLILVRQPFEIGDQIVVNGYEGTVEKIETRATLIKTYDGQRAVIPNSDIYTNAVLVKTAFPARRSQYDVGIGYGDDPDKACEVIIQALRGIEELEKEPTPEAFVFGLDASWVTIRTRWWTASPRADVVRVQAKVLLAIKKALDEARIDMPFPTQVQLWHDQTEERDGVPGKQREGWPAPPEGAVRSRFEASSGSS